MVLINFGEREEKIDMNIWLNNLPDELELAAVGTDSCYVHGYVMSFMHIVCIQSNFDRYCHYCYYHFVRTFSHFGRSKWKWSTQMYNGAQLIDTIKMHTKIWPIYLRRMEQSIICELLFIPFNFTMAVSVSFLLWNYIHVSIFFFFSFFCYRFLLVHVLFLFRCDQIVTLFIVVSHVHGASHELATWKASARLISKLFSGNNLFLSEIWCIFHHLLSRNRIFFFIKNLH